MSYLGKISAIVSANTGDYVRKLNDSARTTQAFAKTIQGDLNRASSDARKAIDSVLTPLQRFERAVQNASGFKLKFRGADLAVQNVRELAVLVSKLERKRDIDFAVRASGMKNITELKAALTAISQDSMDIVARVGVSGLEQIRAQLGTEIGKDGKPIAVKFDVKKAAEYDAAIAAYRQLGGEKQVDILIKAIGKDQLDQAVLKEKQLVSIASEIATPLAAATRKYEQMGLAIQAAFGPALKMAQDSQEKLVTTVEAGAKVTRKEYEATRRTIELTAEAVERIAEAEAMVGKLGTGKSLQLTNPAQYDALRQGEALRARREALSGAATAGFGIGGQEARALKEGQYLSRLMAKRESLIQEKKPTDAIDAAIERQTKKYLDQLEVLKRLILAAEAYQQKRQLGPMAGRTTDVMFGRARERGTAAENLLGVTPRGPTEIPRELDAVGSRINSLRSQIDSLPAGLGRQMIPDLQRIQTEFVTVATRGKATTAEIRNMEMALRRAEMRASRLSAVSNFAKGFGGFGKMGLNLGIDQKWMQGLGAQIEFLQGKLTGLSATARGPAVAAMERLRMVVASGMARGVVGTQGFNEQLKVATQTVVRLTAAAANMRPGRLADQLKRVGDVARGSFSNMGLVVQQGLFAIDDAFSVTGGWDQRIRASANNVSQALFLLGGNYGLIAGVILSATAQGIVGLLKWTGATEKAEDRQRRLKLQLESTNNALERQRDIAKTLADAYRDMARSIRESGLSDRGREELSRNQPMEDLNRKQADQRLAAIEATDPTVGRMNAIIANVDRKLETEENAAERRRLLRRRREAEEQRRLAIETIEGSGATNARAVLGTAGFDEALRQQEEARAAIERRLAAAQNGGPSRAKEAQELSRALAVINNTIQRIQAAASNNGFSAAQRAADRNARAQQNLSGTTGYTFAEYVARKSQEFIESLQEQFNAGQIDFQEFQRLMSQQEEMAKKAEQVSVALASFAKALDDAAASLASALDQEVTQAADRARRQANAAEAEFGANDPRTRAARSDQRELEAERRRIAEERARIEEESSAMRIKFTQDAIAGRGDPRATDIAQRMQEIDEALSPANIGNINTTEQESLRLERNRLEAEMSQIFASSPEAMSLAERADQLDIREQRNNQRRESANRGMELAMSPAERAAREARQGFADIVANYDRQFEELGDRNNGRSFAGQDAEAANLRANRQAAIQRFVNDQMRSAAPAIFEMADAVANAVLQGPSRQALEVSDVSTMEGSKELNRLLRGDDASKNANIVELQKQNQTLTEVRDQLKDVAQKLGIVVNL